MKPPKPSPAMSALGKIAEEFVEMAKRGWISQRDLELTYKPMVETVEKGLKQVEAKS